MHKSVVVWPIHKVYDTVVVDVNGERFYRFYYNVKCENAVRPIKCHILIHKAYP